MALLAAFAVPHPPILLPEIGHGEERKLRSTADAYAAAMTAAASLHPDTVVLTSPHSLLYADYFHISPPEGRPALGNFAQFGAPGLQISAQYDAPFIAALESLCRKAGIPAGTLGQRSPALDHGTMIPLRFLENAGGAGFQVVRIGLSGLSPLTHYRLGQCVAKAAEQLNRRTVFLASGDLSHKLTNDGPYGFSPDGPVFDDLCTRALAAGDFVSLLGLEPALCENAAECGLRSFWVMAGALDGLGVDCRLLSHEGPFGVGYAVASFTVTGPDPSRDCGRQYQSLHQRQTEALRAREDAFTALARQSLESYVQTGQTAPLPECLPPELLHRRAGAFVSLKKFGVLRGCIGTTAPTRDSLAQEIVRNAVAAGTQDPRFPPVTAEELPDLVYSVDVLDAPEPAEEAELDVRRYGVIVSCGSRRGLLLPDLAGVDTVAQQISIARQKGGIRPEEPVTLQRFEVTRHR